MSQSDHAYISSLPLPPLKRMKTSSCSSTSFSSAPIMPQAVWQDQYFRSSTFNPERIFLFDPRKPEEKIQPGLHGKFINKITTTDSTEQDTIFAQEPKAITPVLNIEIDSSCTINRMQKILKSLGPTAKVSKKISLTFSPSSPVSQHLILVLDFLSMRCTQVEHIEIQLEQTRISQKILSKLFTCLKKLPSLRGLSLLLCGNYLYLQDLKPLFQVLYHQNKLQKLNLSLNNNKLNDEFLTSLMNQMLALKRLESLSLSLSFNPITTKGVGKLVFPLEGLKEKLKKVLLNLKNMECDNIAYFKRLFSQFEENKNLEILY